MSAQAAARRTIVATAQAMSAAGLSPGRSGNVSSRHGVGMLITPSAVAYDSMEPDDVVAMDLDGRVDGGGKPSSEWQLHAALYRARPDLGAIVHCHSRHATALACAGRDIPAFHYMVAMAGGSDIRCAAYATFGTPELAQATLAAMEGRRACLLANHGQLAAGDTPRAALDLAIEVEALAAQYCDTLAIGGARILTAEQMTDVLDRFADYGR